MPVTVKAIFEKGQVKLEEPAPTNETVEVTVTFPDIEKPLAKNEIKFGSLTGKITVPSDFDDEMDEMNELFN
jgi:hypothetical protein